MLIDRDGASINPQAFSSVYFETCILCTFHHYNFVILHIQLHCLGVLLNCQQSNPFAHIRDKNGLITNLVSGLQLPR